MAKNTSQAVIKYVKGLLNSEQSINVLMANEGKLTETMIEKVQTILNSDGTFRKIRGATVVVKAGQCRLELECSGRDTPSFVIV